MAKNKHELLLQLSCVKIFRSNLKFTKNNIFIKFQVILC